MTGLKKNQKILKSEMTDLKKLIQKDSYRRK